MKHLIDKNEITKDQMKYSKILFELASHSNIEICLKKIDIEYDELINLMSTDYFKKDLEKKRKEINDSGIDLLQLKIDNAGHEALEVLKEVMNNQEEDSKKRIDASNSILKMTSTNKKQQQQEQRGNTVIVNIQRETKTYNSNKELIDIVDIDKEDRIEKEIK